MEKRWRLRRLLLFLVLEMGALLGVPMKADEIEELTRNMNRPAVIVVERDDEGDPP